MNVRSNVYRFAVAAGVLGTLLAAAMFVLPAAARDGANRLNVKIGQDNPGPLPACSEDGSDCTAANTVRFFIYVENKNPLTNMGGRTRADVRNAFVVNSIDSSTFIDGVQDHDFDFTHTPPPDPSFQPNSGHWATTASCPAESPPCDVVGNPAVLPGEETAIYYSGWIHGNAEPNGTYVFRFTLHGTLNGTPVDLTANSNPIVMTP